MIETYRTLEYIESTLAGDSTLTGLLPAGAQGIWRGIAEKGTSPPFVVYQAQGSHDRVMDGMVRRAVYGVFLIKAIGTEDQEGLLLQIADRVDTLLHATSGSTSDANIVYFYRSAPFWLDVDEAGVKWVQVGGLYQAAAQKK